MRKPRNRSLAHSPTFHNSGAESRTRAGRLLRPAQSHPQISLHRLWPQEAAIHRPAFPAFPGGQGTVSPTRPCHHWARGMVSAQTRLNEGQAPSDTASSPAQLRPRGALAKSKGCRSCTRSSIASHLCWPSSQTPFWPLGPCEPVSQRTRASPALKVQYIPFSGSGVAHAQLTEFSALRASRSERG